MQWWSKTWKTRTYRYSLARPTEATPHKFCTSFDRFLTSLMAVDHFLYTNAQSTEDNVLYFLAFYHAIHQTCQKPVKNLSKTCQKPVKNLYETYAGWPWSGASDCKIASDMRKDLAARKTHFHSYYIHNAKMFKFWTRKGLIQGP